MLETPNNTTIDQATPVAETVNQPVIGNNAGIMQSSPLLCWNCGNPVEQGQLFCPKCGSKTDAPLEINNKIQEFNENKLKKKKAKKKTLIIVIPLLVVALLAGGVASYFFYFEPNERYKEADSLYDDGEYEAAAAMFEELGNFKDSEDRVTQCETAIKQEKYDEAIRKAENNNYYEAIKILEELGDFSDSQTKITELEQEYFELLQQIYAYVSRGFEVDTSLANCVYNVLYASDLYDASDSTAMSRLYSGSSYYVYYYWSRYYNGYAYVVETDTAEAFIYLLSATNENANEIDLLLTQVTNPPEKYQPLYEKVKAMCSTYAAFHKFVSKKPSVSYSSYESYSKSHQNSVKRTMDAVKKVDSKIAGKVAQYDWD